ncbi:MAG: Rrf2 family transcriptional regulator [Rhodoferax sp.]|nr:Rrf2 family transcriptional regulator [Rhodoferax sp.]
MRLSTKGRFAVTAMIELALRENSGPVPLSSIALRHQISLSYLEQMFSKLRLHGLVESTRGPGGGYALGHRADGITVADIIGAIEEEADPGALTTHRLGESITQDMTQELWEALNTKMVDYLQSITLRSLAAEQRAKGFKPEERKPSRQGVGRRPVAEPFRTTAPNSVFALGQSLLAKG